ncbi:hypothetical protein PR048_000912 [Dryococelus australis]|uniref:Uncharacterized protein n=1 Tax=Dryococelus australis TaxID=614101 RepID=A0ABQ9IG16_9NEOP|nr:hypothetical protein PR048_000912 [Dryococelus australis]
MKECVFPGRTCAGAAAAAAGLTGVGVPQVRSTPYNGTTRRGWLWQYKSSEEAAFLPSSCHALSWMSIVSALEHYPHCAERRRTQEFSPRERLTAPPFLGPAFISEVLRTDKGWNEARMEQRRNEKSRETGYPRENPADKRHHPARFPLAKIPEGTLPVIEPGSPWWEASRLTALRYEAVAVSLASLFLIITTPTATSAAFPKCEDPEDPAGNRTQFRFDRRRVVLTATPSGLLRNDSALFNTNTCKFTYYSPFALTSHFSEALLKTLLCSARSYLPLFAVRLRAAPERKVGGKQEIPEKTLPTSGIVRHDSHLRKSGSDPAGNQSRFAQVRGEWSNHYSTATPPSWQSLVKINKGNEAVT